MLFVCSCLSLSTDPAVRIHARRLAVDHSFLRPSFSCSLQDENEEDAPTLMTYGNSSGGGRAAGGGGGGSRTSPQSGGSGGGSGGNSGGGGPIMSNDEDDFDFEDRPLFPSHVSTREANNNSTTSSARASASSSNNNNRAVTSSSTSVSENEPVSEG